MRHSKKRWKGRARSASADSVFEQALFGSDSASSKPFDPRTDRKTLQLCRQVQRALMLSLAGECGDDLLRDVMVESVEPLGASSQLLVRVSVPRAIEHLVIEVSARLNERVPRLRAAVAASICRKRVPMLAFIAVPSSDDIAGIEVHDERE